MISNAGIAGRIATIGTESRTPRRQPRLLATVANVRGLGWIPGK